MPSTLPTPNELRQHAVVQALTTAYTRQFGHTTSNNPPNSHKLWLACSGGRDSLGLAYACVLCNLPIRIIHINHNLQDPSVQWQNCVANYAKTWSLPFEAHDVYLTNKTEIAARKARFDKLFAQMANHDILLLGHHADDQAETLLMNLCKGSGLKGLSGMANWTTRNIRQKRTHTHETATSLTEKVIHLWRPWLLVTREQITDFVTKAQLNFVDDPTNILSSEDTVHQNDLTTNTRAFLRSEVFPQLASHWERVVENMGRTATIVAEAEGILAEQTQTDLLTLTTTNQDSLDNTLNVNQLLQLPVARQYRALASWIQDNEVYAPPREHVEQVQKLAQSENKTQRTQLHWQNTQVRRYKNQLYRLPNALAVAKNQNIQLTHNSTLSLPSGHWQVQLHRAEETNLKAGLPLHLLDKPLRLRPRELGERIHILGRVGSWPLKKFFQSQQIAPWQRDQAHILQADGNDIALICHAGFFLLDQSSAPLTTCHADQNAYWLLQPNSSTKSV